jgi:hypothetical protein
VQSKVFQKLGIAAVLILAFQGPALANGALAIDSNQGDQYGFSYNHPSMGAAEQRAVSECGRGCSVVLRFSSGCAAYAADQARGSTAYGWATAGSGGAAQNAALNECRQRGAGRANCTVRAWGCNGR